MSLILDAFLFFQNARQTRKKMLCEDMCGEDTVSERVCHNCFTKFHADDTMIRVQVMRSLN